MPTMITFCFLFNLLLSFLTVSYGQTCASGWTLYGSTCYKFSGTGTWTQCFSACASSYPGAMLLCIHNSDEKSWIIAHTNANYWIGYTDMTPYGSGKGTKLYGWITGCSSTYTNWSSGQPKGGNQDYAYMYTNGQWKDSGTSVHHCGCQYNVLQTVPTKKPTTAPSTVTPTNKPTRPSIEPSVNPSSEPTSRPTGPSFSPSRSPSNPTRSPSVRATIRPTRDPSFEPTNYPSYDPTSDPTYDPTTPELIGERK